MMSKICNNLNTSVCFNYDEIGITYCTLTNATNGLGWPKIPDDVFDGEKIDWDKFFDRRAEEIEAIKNGTQELNVFSVFLISALSIICTSINKNKLKNPACQPD